MLNGGDLALEVKALVESAFRAAQDKYLNEPMKSMLDYHFSSGGKRLRPLLVFGTALGIDRNATRDQLLPYALAVELIHNATLIHDDIQDEDRLRRGSDTLWVKYSLAQAINCGDAWFFQPQLLVQDAAYPAELKLKLLRILQEGTLAVIQGQAEEFALKGKFAGGETVRRTEYLHMVSGKTSALFSMPVLGGAMIAGADEGLLNRLRGACDHLGHAFQIQDDLLDLWGEKGRDRKGSDVAEGKLSYPLVILLEKISGAEEERVRKIVLAPRERTSDADIAYVTGLMEQKGAKKEALQHFHGHISAAEREGAALAEDMVKWLRESVIPLS